MNKLNESQQPDSSSSQSVTSQSNNNSSSSSSQFLQHHYPLSMERFTHQNFNSTIRTRSLLREELKYMSEELVQMIRKEYNTFNRLPTYICLRLMVQDQWRMFRESYKIPDPHIFAQSVSLTSFFHPVQQKQPSGLEEQINQHHNIQTENKMKDEQEDESEFSKIFNNLMNNDENDYNSLQFQKIKRKRENNEPSYINNSNQIFDQFGEKRMRLSDSIQSSPKTISHSLINLENDQQTQLQTPTFPAVLIFNKALIQIENILSKIPQDQQFSPYISRSLNKQSKQYNQYTNQNIDFNAIEPNNFEQNLLDNSSQTSDISSHKLFATKISTPFSPKSKRINFYEEQSDQDQQQSQSLISSNLKQSSQIKLFQLSKRLRQANKNNIGNDMINIGEDEQQINEAQQIINTKMQFEEQIQQMKKNEFLGDSRGIANNNYNTIIQPTEQESEMTMNSQLSDQNDIENENENEWGQNEGFFITPGVLKRMIEKEAKQKETKQNETKQKEAKQNETNQKEAKQKETKQKEEKQNDNQKKIDLQNQNKTQIKEKQITNNQIKPNDNTISQQFTQSLSFNNIDQKDIQSQKLQKSKQIQQDEIQRNNHPSSIQEQQQITHFEASYQKDRLMERTLGVSDNLGFVITHLSLGINKFVNDTPSGISNKKLSDKLLSTKKEAQKNKISIEIDKQILDDNILFNEKENNSENKESPLSVFFRNFPFRSNFSPFQQSQSPIKQSSSPIQLISSSKNTSSSSSSFGLKNNNQNQNREQQQNIVNQKSISKKQNKKNTSKTNNSNKKKENKISPSKQVQQNTLQFKQRNQNPAFISQNNIDFNIEDTLHQVQEQNNIRQNLNEELENQAIDDSQLELYKFMANIFGQKQDY